MNEKGNSRLFWQLDYSDPGLADKLRESLREVFDPELGLNVIQLGLIRDVFLNNNELKIKMILTTLYCPYAPVMLELTQKKVQTALNIPASVELDMQVWDFTMMEEGSVPDWGLY
jgi:metal-sulfur cluster biosynthetic enzyme